MDQDNPLVSVIILNYNGCNFLKSCLDSVLAVEYSNFEIIVVDNGSTDGSAAFLEEFYGKIDKIVIIKKDKNYGVGAGRNFGLSGARGEYIVFLDNDAIVDPCWIKGFFEAFDSDKKIGLTQSKILNMAQRNKFDHAGDYLTSFGFLAERSGGEIDQGQFDRVEDIFNAKGAAFMVKKSVLNETGVFDNTFFMYLEETDLCWRVWLAGYRVVFAPKSVVWHAFATPLKDEKRHYSNYVVRYYGCRNYMITLLKNAGFIQLLKMVPIQLSCFLLLAFLFALKRKFKDSFYIIKAIFSVIFDFRVIMEKRNFVQKKVRKLADKDFYPFILQKQPLKNYIRKAACYVSGRHY